MAFNGSGTYSLPGTALSTGGTVSATEHNTFRNDVANALSTVICKDGQTTVTANLPMATYKHTGVGDATALTDYAAAGQIVSGAITYLTSVAGTDTITATAAIPPSAYAAGQRFSFVSAGANTGAATLNVSSLGAKAITKLGATALAAGDIPSSAVVEVVYDGTQFQITNLVSQHSAAADSATTATNIAGGAAGSLPYQTGSGATSTLAIGTAGQVLAVNSGATAPEWTTLSTSSQCRLTLSAGSLLLSPQGGNLLTINGTAETVPSAGVTLAATGLSATTLYYIYAYMNAGTMTLEASTTAYSVDTTTGMPIKTGDATRTLVGMVYVKTAATFADSATQRFVLSYFNRRNISGEALVTTNRTTTSASFVELNTADRVEYITWGDDSVYVAATGSVQTSINGPQTYLAAGKDAGRGDSQQCTPYSTSGPIESMTSSWSAVQTEGYHYSSIWGAISSGTYTLLANYARTTVTVRG